MQSAPSVDTSGTERAQRAIADAQTAANNLSQNFQKDLKTENITQITPGGDSAAATDVASAGPKRKRSSGLASQLGIDV